MVGGSPMKVLLVSSHPVQYAAPLYRLYSADPRLDVTVAYCSLQGAKPGVDSDFGMMIAWDVPLLDGHRWVCPPNHSPQPGLRGFFGLVNPGLWRPIRTGGFEAVVAYTGYRCASFWIAAAAAKMSGATFLFGTDAHGLRPLDGRRWKIRLKRWLWPRLFRLADVVIVPSSGGVRLMEDLGIPPERIVLTPYVVDNAWWQRQAQRVDRKTVRRQWGIPDDSVVVLFCAKLVPWKRAMALLIAYGSHVLMATASDWPSGSCQVE
jgi:glycosyltransferase involved in cell wall biosynthesis